MAWTVRLLAGRVLSKGERSCPASAATGPSPTPGRCQLSVAEAVPSAAYRPTASRLSLHGYDTRFERVTFAFRRATVTLRRLQSRNGLSTNRHLGHGDDDHAGAKAWLTSLSCRKAKELGYPHELWTTRLLARHAREHGPAEGHACLANTKMAVPRIAAPAWSCAGSRGGAQILAIERQDVEGIQLDFVIVLPRVQGIEIGNTVHPKDDSFAINELICWTTRRVLQTSQK